jgi:uncharacterized protein YehS (DUF1456 family)
MGRRTRGHPVRDVRTQVTVMIDVETSSMFSILASDEFARFLNGLVAQTEGSNQSKPTKELCNV